MSARQTRRGSYRAAIQWIAENDDNTWLDDEEPIPSVTASLVADLFGRTDEEVARDLRLALSRARQTQ